MEDVKEFLKAVLEPTGLIYLAWFKSSEGKASKPKFKFFDAGQYDEAAAFAAHLDANSWDVYFCTSTLNTTVSRKADNVKLCKTFKLDIDIDPEDEEKYPSRAVAIADIEEKRQKIGLPMPVYVKSGSGIHAYLPVRDALTPKAMQLMSGKLKAVCAHLDIKADVTCTADITRILRVPGTHNYKKLDKPSAVKLATPVRVYENHMVIDAIEAAYADVPPMLTAGIETLVKTSHEALFGGGGIPAHIQKDQMDETTIRLYGGTRKSFQTIMLKNGTPEGCEQLRLTCDKELQKDAPEKCWWDAVSIAANCDDAEKMIHVISEHHPEYEYGETVAKANNVMGKPHLCSTFNLNRKNVCDGCKHWGKISSPIQLGTYTPLAKPTDNIVLGRNKMFDEEETEYTIPVYPGQYARKEGGGVVFKPEDVTKPDVEICRYDFYAVRRLKARDNYIMQFRVHKPMDGVQEFAISTTDIGAKDKLQNALNAWGIMAVDGRTKLLQNYVIDYLHHMEMVAEAEYVKEQFGWTNKFKSFVVGNAEYTASKTLFSPPAPQIAKEAQYFRKEGSFDDWRDAYNTYARPGAEAHAFSALIGFATPLMTFTGFGGVTVNIMNSESGIGKTVSMFAQLSIWGDPDQKAQMLTYKDTNASKLNRLGIMCNLPLCVDEVTLMRTEHVSELIFDVSYGRGNNRMNGSSNTERANNATWNTIVTLSSNTNWTDKIQLERAGSNGEMARLMEIKAEAIPGMDKQGLTELSDAFKSNFGHAGEIFVKQLLKDVGGVRQRLKDEVKRFDADVKVQPSERYWTAVFACVYLGGKIAKECGLHDMDMEHMRKWMIKTMDTIRATAKLNVKPSERDHGLLGEFLSMNAGKTIVAYKNSKNNGYTVPEPPRGEVIVRYEPEEKHVFILTSALKEYCTKRNVHVQVFLEEQHKKGSYVREVNKRMLSGHLPSEPSRAYQFNLSDDEMLPGVIRD